MDMKHIRDPLYICPECGGWLRLWRVFTVREVYDVGPLTGTTTHRTDSREHQDSAVECPACGFYSPEGEGLFVVNQDGDVDRPEPVADQTPF